MIKPIQNWLDRHKNPTSFWLHIIGVPACFVAAPIFLVMWLTGEPTGWVALGMFAGGYALQFIGHLVEGNRSGEAQVVRRIAERLTRRGTTGDS